MFLTIILLVTVICVIILYFWKVNYRYNYFKYKNLPGPQPHFLYNYYNVFDTKKTYSKQIEEWTHQYGSIYGLFEGTQPVYVVSDVDFLQDVYIEQFSSFHSRPISRILRIENDGKIHLFRANGRRWRHQRDIIDLMFSTVNLNSMAPWINDSLSTMLENLSEIARHRSIEINIFDFYKRMSMDIICRCALNIDSSFQRYYNISFLNDLEEICETNTDQLSIFQLSNLMPFLTHLLHEFLFCLLAVRKKAAELIPTLRKYIREFPVIILINQIYDTINRRRKSLVKSNEFVDFLQFMIDTSINDEISDDTVGQLRKKALNLDEVASNIFIFIAAGFETVSTTLAYCTYVLATKPDIQEKLFLEINQNRSNSFDEEYINYIARNLSYLDMFIREVLRMYPITTKAMRRECTVTTMVRGNIVEKGCIIQPDILSIHYNQDLWGPEDPYSFVPERHKTKRHSVAYISFGVGPRNCVGTKFALMEIKICLVRLLAQYKILPGENLEQGFKCKERFTIQPDALFIRLERR